MKKRVQLTLFVDPQNAVALERIRQTWNPAQFALIKAHVTLCREDELTPLERVIDNLNHLRERPVRVQFGPPTRFSEGKGLLLPAIGANEAFQALRVRVLKGVVEAPRRHEAHITL
ncbi:MAG TPA: 2'-5' RNA ligase family protein, partial [Saprospiraceae bacterium]|nr:2'-5' RNA ligase family protein [Saprospiraceae bacterium]